MKRLWWALPLVVLMACGGAEAGGRDKPKTSVTLITETNIYGDAEYREVKVNGRHCITFDNPYGGGISCDWSPK